MSGQIRFISDPHFNHKNMAIKRGFDNIDDMNNMFIENWNKVVKKKDSTYILGDITMETKKGYELLDELNGYKFVVLGNHDRRQDVRELLNHVNGVCGMFNYKKCIITHCPVHYSELKYRYKYNIHGHTHSNHISKNTWDFLSFKDREIYDKRYINVCAEVINYTPKTLKELIGN